MDREIGNRDASRCCVLKPAVAGRFYLFVITSKITADCIRRKCGGHRWCTVERPYTNGKSRVSAAVALWRFFVPARSIRKAYRR